MARRPSLTPSLTLQDSIDEENRSVLSDLTQTQYTSQSPTTKAIHPSSQTMYARNTLNADEPPNTRRGSGADIGMGMTSPIQGRRKRSAGLDPSDPSTWTSSHRTSLDERPRASFESQGPEPPTVGLEPQRFQESAAAPNTAQAQTQNLPSGTSSSVYGAPSRGLISSQTVVVPPSTDRSGSFAVNDVSRSPQSPRHLAPSDARTLGINNDGTSDGRRFSNQSASFSTTTDGSERIGSIAAGDENDDEEVLHESSEDDQSSSDLGEGSPDAERGRNRKSIHEPDLPELPGDAEIRRAPEITINDASGLRQEHPHPPEASGKLSETHSTVTPRSNYNRAASPAALSARGDDDAELRRAQALQLRVSPVDDKIKDRSVKMLIRGDWSAFQDPEDEDQLSRHEPRLYLVCSDLSNEASFALEWTVGTLLKDGDTLLIINAIEDENAPKHKEADEEPSLEIRLESAKAAEEANSTLEALTRQTTNSQADAKYEGSKKSKLGNFADPVRSLSRGDRTHSKKEDDRVKAVDKLESDFLRYVRKTTLQVRYMIEVIHCRSPRHLILNAIDELEPTLVVVGTRGLGAVKNVLIGSFSNYLVTKSSIPVMVARKRLKKPHHAKVGSEQIRMTNNLTPSGPPGKRKSLIQARID